MHVLRVRHRCGGPPSYVPTLTDVRPPRTAYVAGPLSSALIAAIMPRAMSSISKIVNNSFAWCVLHEAVVDRGTLDLCRVVCDVDRPQLWLVRSGCTNFGNSCGVSSWAAFPLHSGPWERSCLVRVLHQAPHSTAPNQALRAALSTSCLAEGSDRWNFQHPNLPKRATYESPLSHPFTVFLFFFFFFFRRVRLFSSKSISSIATGLVLTAAIFSWLSSTVSSRRNFNQGTFATLV